MSEAIPVRYRHRRGTEAIRAVRHSGLSVATFPRTHIDSIRRDWEDLIERAAEDNLYYAPCYAMALLETVEQGQNVQFVTVWSGDKLVALLPVILNRFGVPGIWPVASAWRSDYTFGCMPILDNEHLDEAAGGLVDALAALRPGDWSISQLNAGGRGWNALTMALNRRNIPWSELRPFCRASLSTGQSFEEHMCVNFGSKRRRELARNRRRLEEVGAVAHKACLLGDELDDAIETFLVLEAGGWKGQRGTALASRADSKAFAKKAFGSRAAGRPARADLLLLDGKPIAAGLIAFSGKTGFTVKGAYDEAYAAYGPGLLLEVEVLRSFLEERWADRLDAATDGAHVIDKLWPGRVKVAELAFSLSPRAPHTRLWLYQRSQSLWTGAKSGIKRALGR